MRKKILVGFAIGMFMFGTLEMTQACDGDEGFYGEGPEYASSQCKATSFSTAKTKNEYVDHKTFFTEGLRVSEAIKGQNTLIIASLAGSFYSEGRDPQLSGNKAINSLRSQALDAMPAAGK